MNLSVWECAKHAWHHDCMCVWVCLTRIPSAADTPGCHNTGWAGHLAHSCRCTPERPPSAGQGPRWSSAGTDGDERRQEGSVYVWRHNFFVHLHWGASFSSLSLLVCVCVMHVFSLPGDLSLAVPLRVINWTFTAQGYDTGPDIAQTAKETQCGCGCGCVMLTQAWWPPTFVFVCVQILTSGLECWKMMRGRVRSRWAWLTRYSLSRDLAAPSFCPSHRCRNGTIHWKASFI